MDILKIELSENKKAVDYIREYDAIIYTKLGKVDSVILIEDTSMGQNVDITFNGDAFYPLIEIRKELLKYIMDNKL